jgi:hypothetical protein
MVLDTYVRVPSFLVDFVCCLKMFFFFAAAKSVYHLHCFAPLIVVLDMLLILSFSFLLTVPVLNFYHRDFWVCRTIRGLKGVRFVIICPQPPRRKDEPN